MDPIFEKNLITTKEAGDHSGYSSDYLARLARSGKIDGKRIGHSWFIDKESLANFLDQQGTRKIDYARALAREREREYRKQHSFLHTVEKTLSNPLPIPSLNIERNALRSQAIALSVALLVVVSGAFVANAAPSSHLTAEVTAIAREVAFGFNATFGNIPSRIALKINSVSENLSAYSARVIERNEIASAEVAPKILIRPDLSFLQMILPDDTRLLAQAGAAPHFRSENSLLSVPSAPTTSLTAKNIQSSLSDGYAFVTNPSRVAHVFTNAYSAIGDGAYASIVASLSGYHSLITHWGTKAFSIAIATRDIFPTSQTLHEANTAVSRSIDRINLAFGNSIINTTHRAIQADVLVAYGLSAAAPASARVVVAFTGNIGDAVAGAAERVPVLATTVFLRATEAPATFAPAFAQTIFDAEYAGASPFVAFVTDVSDGYLSALVSAGRFAYATHIVSESGYANTLAFTHTVSSLIVDAPATLSANWRDAYLGMLGKTALAFDTIARVPKVATALSALHSATQPMLAAVAPTLSAGEQVALVTYKTITDFFDSANRVLATLIGPPPTIVMTNPPTVGLKAHITPTATTTSSATSLGENRITYSSPTYTTIVKGVSEDFMNQSLASLRSDVLATVAGMIQPISNQVATNVTTIQQVNMIEDLSDLIVRNGDFRGGTFSGNLAVSGTATFTNTPILSSLKTAAGTFLAVDATGQIIATTTPTSGSGSGTVGTGTTGWFPYYAADGTTLTATSSLFLAASGNIGIGTTSPQGSLTIHSGQLTIPAGSNSTPSLTFNNDLDTGIYSVNPNTISFSIGGNLRASINTNTASLPDTIGFMSDASVYMKKQGADEIGFITADAERVRISSIGNLGIGTTSPYALLSIGGDVVIGAATAGGTLGNLYLPKLGTAAGTFLAVDATGKVIATTTPGGSGGVDAGTAGWFPYYAADGTTLTATSSLFLASTGNIGIGTTTPSARLSIVSTGGDTASYGAEMVVDGAFPTLDNWTTAGGWSASAGTAVHATGNTNTLSQSLNLTASTNYIASFTVAGYTAGNILMLTIGAYEDNLQVTANGDYTYFFSATSTEAQSITFTPTSTFTGNITNVSVVPITGTTKPTVYFGSANSDGNGSIEIRGGGSGLENTFIGYESGLNNTTGSNNSSLGHWALRSNTTGSSNTAIGYISLYSNTTGINNTAVGYFSLRNNTTGSFNTAMGMWALNNNRTGSYSVAIGESALSANTTGSRNTAVGFRTLMANTTGERNTAFGHWASYVSTTGSYNSTLGYAALYQNHTGHYNTALGYLTSYNNTSATSTTAIGSYAAYGSDGYSNQNGTYVGYKSGYNVETGSNNNSFFGYQSGLANTTGANNLFLGYQAGSNVTTGSNNIVIGYDVDAPSATASNQLNIGGLIYGDTSTKLMGIGTTSPFANLSIAGIAGGTTNLFAISTSTAAFATTTALTINQNGDLSLLNGANLSVGGNLTVTGTTNLIGATTFPLAKGNFIVGNDAGIAQATSTISISSLGDLNTLNINNAGTATTSRLCFGSDASSCMNAPVVSGSNITLYHWNGTADIAGYEMFRTVPDTTAEADESCLANSSVAGGYCDIDNYVSTTTISAQGPLVITKIPPGTFTFNYFTYVDSAAGVSKIESTIYKRTALGVETYVGQATSTEINNTSAGFTSFRFTNISEITFTSTDRLVSKVRVWTDSPAGKTIHFIYGGTAHYSNVSTPMTLASEAVAFLPANNTFTGLNTFGNASSSQLSISGNTYFPNGIWNSSGSVGIGTTSPYSLLSISNSATTPINTPLFTISSTTAGTSTTTLMTILANGNVGIGTTSPARQLHVVSPNLDGIRIESTGSSANLEFYEQDTTATNRNWRISANGGTAGTFTIYNSSTQGAVAGNNVFRIDSLGNVTVNTQGYTGGGTYTTNAKTSTDTISNIFTAALDRASGTGGIGLGLSYLFRLEDSSGAQNDAGQFDYSWVNPTNGANVSKFNLKTMNGGVLVNALTANGSNVGIGTTNPLYKLEVNGTASSTSLVLGTALATAYGGMGTTTWQTNSIPYFNGTYFTSNNPNLNFNGATLSAANISTGGTLNVTGVTTLATSLSGLLGANSGGVYSIATSSPLNTSITGNAATVTTNANLTGVVTSIGNTTSWGTLAKGNFLVGNDAGIAQATSTIFISSTGSVGIGTTSPDTWNTGFTRQFTISTGGANVSSASIGIVGGTTGRARIDMGNDTILRAGIVAIDGSHLTFNTNNSNSGTTLTERVRIQNNGNVGIGTTNPGATLNVIGTAAIGTTTTGVFDQVGGGARPLIVSASDSATTIGGSVATLSINNDNSTTNNTSALAFTSYSGSGSIHWADAEIVAIHGARNEGSYNPGQLAFLTSNGGGIFAPTEKMRIDSSGNVGIGTTSPATLLEVGGATPNVTFDGYKNCTAITSNGNGLLGCTASDERVKQNIVSLDATSGLAAINALNPVSFNWRDTTLGTAEQFGLIAQEVESVFPNLVQTTNPTDLTPDGTLTINYYGLIAPMIKSIQELDARTRWMETTTSIDGMPSEVLTADGESVDLYKLATYNLSSVQALSEKVDAHEVRLTSLETRIDSLESGAVSSSSGTSTFSTTSLASAFEGFGVLIQKGIAQFNTLVFRQLVASKDADGTSSAGSVSILTGNTVAQVNNSLVMPSTKVFITFNSQIAGSWWVSDKAVGSFRVVLSEAQPVDVSFDYFLVQTEGQMATSTPDGSFITSPSVSQSNGPDTVPPVITLLGDNPIHISVGGVFIDPGITAIDAVDGTVPVVTYINGVQQEVSASTILASSQTTYIITYAAADSAGNNATPVTRSIIVGNPAPDESQDPDASDGGNAPSDTTSPVVTLVGDAAMQITANDAFTDPGATALDDTDGDITADIVVTGSVDTTTAGLYTITYTATDAGGNVGIASRVVTVVAAPVEPII